MIHQETITEVFDYMKRYNIMYDLFFCIYILHYTEKKHTNFHFQLSLIDLSNHKKYCFFVR